MLKASSLLHYKPWCKRVLVWFPLARLNGLKLKYFQHCDVTNCPAPVSKTYRTVTPLCRIKPNILWTVTPLMVKVLSLCFVLLYLSLSSPLCHYHSVFDDLCLFISVGQCQTYIYRLYIYIYYIIIFILYRSQFCFKDNSIHNTCNFCNMAIYQWAIMEDRAWSFPIVYLIQLLLSDIIIHYWVLVNIFIFHTIFFFTSTE